MFIGILYTYYEVYAIGSTEDEVKKNILKGYKKTYPPTERRFENPTYDELAEWFGVHIHEIDPKVGYTHQ